MLKVFDDDHRCSLVQHAYKVRIRCSYSDMLDVCMTPGQAQVSFSYHDCKRENDTMVIKQM
jgi:hypothetical protein